MTESVLEDPSEFWEDRYAQSDRVWSGRPNHVLTEVVPGLTPGRALDLGCGEGADVIWLAQQGWRVVGADISSTATERGRQAAHRAGLTDDQASFVAADLSQWIGQQVTQYDLVTASFFQSPVALDRVEVLTKAAELVTTDGHMLITSHGEPPPWASAAHREALFLSAQEEVEALALDPETWRPIIVDMRSRNATSPSGEQAHLIDSVVLLQRI